MPTQVSIQLTDAQLAQINKLQQLGFGTRSDIVRIAIDRLFQQETQTMKLLTLTAGSRSNPVHAQVEFSGTLTANVAVEAAKRAFGHANGVTVCDPDTMTKYRVTRGKAKDITDSEESALAMMEQTWREQAAE